MQRTFFKINFISHHSGCLFLFCRVMWIIINVNPNMMHIFFFFLMFGFALFIVFFSGVGVLCILRLLRIEIYFCY